MQQTNKLDQFEIARKPDGAFWELGRGTIGIVYKAVDTHLQSEVALKVSNPQHLNSEMARERFLGEARMMANFRHPNVATLFQAGNSEGRIYCAMEYIEGETVEQRVKREGPLEPAVAVRITSQVTRALIAADRRSLIHGDIKPSNLMLLLGSLVKVTDYGLARCLIPASGRSARTDSVAGPGYASPEEKEADGLDIRSDIYSLGATLWFMLTGLPYQGLMIGVVEQPQNQPLATEIWASFPKRLVSLLEQMLAKRPEDRFQAPLELKSELDQLLRELKDQDWTPPERVAQGREKAKASAVGFFAGQLIRNEYLILNESPLEKNVFQAKELQSDRIVTLYPLPLEASYDAQWLNNLESKIDKLRATHHPNLLHVIGLESHEDGFFVVSENVNGFSLEEFVRSRRHFSWTEALPMVKPLAEALDCAAEQQILTKQLELKDLFIDVLNGSGEGEKLRQSSISNWPPFAVKVNLLSLSQVSSEHFSRPPEDGIGNQSQIKQLSILIYELLSGVKVSTAGSEPAPRFSPVSGLSEDSNALLRLGASEPSRFNSAGDFVRQLEMTESDAKVQPSSTAVGTPAAVGVQSAVAEKATEDRPTRQAPSLLRTLSRLTALLVLSGIAAFFVMQFCSAQSASPTFDPSRAANGSANTAITNIIHTIQTSFARVASAVQTSFTGVANAVPLGHSHAAPTSFPKAIPTTSAIATPTSAANATPAASVISTPTSVAEATPVISASATLTTSAIATPTSVANATPAGTVISTPTSVAEATPANSATANPTYVAKVIQASATATVSPGSENALPAKVEKSPSPSVLPEVGRLMVRSEPAGLKVEIVNQAQETFTELTPMTRENLPTGQYAVRIQRDGWPDYQQEVNLQPDALQTVDHTFEAAKVTLKSDPTGASISIGTSELGKTPMTVSLPPKPVELVSRSGILPPVTERIVPNPNDSSVVEFKHSYGLVSANSNRPDAEVILDGVDVGRVPIEEVVPPGRQQLIVQVPGMPDQMQTAEVQNGQRVVLQFNFTTPVAAPATPPIPEAPPSSSRDVNRSQLNQNASPHRRARHQQADKSNLRSGRASRDPSCPADARRDSTNCSPGVAQTKSTSQAHQVKQSSDSCN